MIRSDAFRSLSAYGVKAVVDVSSEYDGKNNGNLSAAWSVMKDRGWNSKSTLWAALKEAVEKGFLKVARPGNKHHVCTLYAITWKPVDECGGIHWITVETLPTNDWKAAQKEADMRTHVFDMRTLRARNDQKAA
jgi:hypothetical protein